MYRQSITLCSGNQVSAAIPNQAAEAVLAIPSMSEMYFFWSGNGRPETAVRGWRRSLEHVYTAADLKRNGKKLRAHTHMLRHTFAIEKLNAGRRWKTCHCCWRITASRSPSATICGSTSGGRSGLHGRRWLTSSRRRRRNRPSNGGRESWRCPWQALRRNKSMVRPNCQW